jgi:hypothetical protein
MGRHAVQRANVKPVWNGLLENLGCLSIDSSAATLPSVTFLAFAVPCAVLVMLSYDCDVRIVRWPLEISHYPALRDFANLWSGGVAALSGNFEVLFDKVLHREELARLLGIPRPSLVWSYPPTAILPLVPLALLPYAWAGAAWTIAGVSVYVRVAGAIGTDKKEAAARLAAVALCPGVFLCLTYGQTAFFTSALLIIGIREAHRWPVFAGACMALLVAKPHVALVVPVALVALKAWRALVLTALFVAAFVGATILAFGLEPWKLFWNTTLPAQVAVLNAPTFQVSMMISPYFLLRGLGLSIDASYALQLWLSLLSMTWLFFCLRREPDEKIRVLLVACVALVVSPYMQAYELPLLVAAVSGICASKDSCLRLGDRWLTAMFAGVTLVPFVILTQLTELHVNFVALVPLTLLLGLGWRSIERSRA